MLRGLEQCAEHRSPGLWRDNGCSMKLNDTAAAYGLFQLVFADVTDHLAVATFRLREEREPNLAFEDVFRQEFKKTLKQFRRELRQFHGRPSVEDSLRAIGEACKIMSKLAVWRNERIHARVRLTDDGYALYVWRTRRRLVISQEEIERDIQLAIRLMVELEAHVPHLVRLLEWDEEFEALLSTVPELSQPDGTQAEDGSM